MKILREKIFGAIKKANKAKKRSRLIGQGRRLELTSDLLDHNRRPVEYYNNLPEEQMIRRARGFKGLGETEDKLARKLKVKEIDPAKFMQDRKKKAATAKEENAMNAIISSIDDLLDGKTPRIRSKKPFVSWEARHKAEKEAEKQKELAAKKAERLAASKASIEKHKGKAEELRDNNKLSIAARDAKRWIKKNPGKASAIGLGTAAIVGGTAYGIKKAVDKKKKDKKDEK